MSSVTAVPLQPLSRGTVAKLWIGLLIVVLLGIGLAWIGTASQQITTTASDVRYRVVDEGEGEKMTPADLAFVNTELRGPDGRVLQPDQGQPQPLTLQSSPPWLAEIVAEMRQGGAYQLFVPATTLTNGAPLPPESGIQAGDRVELRIRVAQIARGMAAMQQMMGGPGGPRGPAGPGGAEGPSGPAGPGGPGGTAGPGNGPSAQPAPSSPAPSQPAPRPGNGQ